MRPSSCSRSFVSLASTLLVLTSCRSEPAETSEPLAPGDYVLEGEASLDTIPGPRLRQERLALFVPERGSTIPWYVRDERTGQLSALSFDADGLSDDVCSYDGCDLRVERDTGCAVYTYESYFRPEEPCQDSGYALTGVVRACPTDEEFVPHLTLEGHVDPGTILPDGSLVVRTNFPLDAYSDTIDVRVDGVTQTFAPAIEGHVIELGSVPLGAEVDVTYAGSRELVPSIASPLSTSDVLTDFAIESAPPSGAIDARGQELVYESGSLVLRDEGRCPRAPFVVLVALGDAGSATQLHVTADHGERFTSSTQAQLVRADGTASEPVGLSGPELDLEVPAGSGAVSLLLTNPQVAPAPDDVADPTVFSIHALEWR